MTPDRSADGARADVILNIRLLRTLKNGASKAVLASNPHRIVSARTFHAALLSRHRDSVRYSKTLHVARFAVVHERRDQQPRLHVVFQIMLG